MYGSPFEDFLAQWIRVRPQPKDTTDRQRKVGLFRKCKISIRLKAGFHIIVFSQVVLGRFGSFQKGEATLDDREDYMETKPRRPTSDRKRPYGSRRSYRVISVTSIFRKDLERPETTQNDPKRLHVNQH